MPGNTDLRYHISRLNRNPQHISCRVGLENPFIHLRRLTFFKCHSFPILIKIFDAIYSRHAYSRNYTVESNSSLQSFVVVSFCAPQSTLWQTGGPQRRRTSQFFESMISVTSFQNVIKPPNLSSLLIKLCTTSHQNMRILSI